MEVSGDEFCCLLLELTTAATPNNFIKLLGTVGIDRDVGFNVVIAVVDVIEIIGHDVELFGYEIGIDVIVEICVKIDHTPQYITIHK